MSLVATIRNTRLWTVCFKTKEVNLGEIPVFQSLRESECVLPVVSGNGLHLGQKSQLRTISGLPFMNSHVLTINHSDSLTIKELKLPVIPNYDF